MAKITIEVIEETLRKEVQKLDKRGCRGVR